ncbi:MAG: PSD1 and planctomycete cytochrome C domain-containing protein [Bryobacteraceae bacterium]|nr:PSD1 and planctomycete cytochrome C domain-containing protein [Bryobacteraceae bacterium]
MLMRWISPALVVAVALAQDSPLEHFEKKIRPVLAARCYACHSAQAPTPQGGLLLDSAKSIREGGNSGPLSGTLLRALSHKDSALKMPPGKPLPAETVAEFEVWMRNGAPVTELTSARAKTERLWSLMPPTAQPAPATRDSRWARTDIDRFILAKLEAKGLAPQPEAERATLIRRLYFDLTGLPPTKAAVDAFVADRSPRAYEQLVDQLLASPRYGERWARHWLDVARYADSNNDAVNSGIKFPWSYTYRDWVIEALNEDLPYDKFLQYQLAADRVPGLSPRHLAALGYLSLGREFPKSIPETVDDRIDAVTRGMLGFTVACARCHDHKFDPIPTKDYYSLYSIFSNIQPPAELPLLASPPAANAKDREYEKLLARSKSDFTAYRQRRHAEMVAFFRSQEAEYQKAARDTEGLTALEVEEMVRERQLNSHVLARWRKKVEDPSAVPLDEFEQIYTEGDSNNSRAHRNRYTFLLSQYAYDGAAPRAMAMEDVPQPVAARVFVRGNPANPGALTPPRFLSAIAGADSSEFRNGSGRAELAAAIIDPRNPLTARVMVNRVWMHHFGAGLVRTPSDFGLRGELPSHQDLLDWLAVKFVESGWSLKKLHRMILLSSVYRQGSGDNELARKSDPENLLLWKMNRRRLEIESLRDAMLSASGQLDLKLGGVPFALNSLPTVPRRTVYAFIERGRVPGTLAAFDFASPDQHAPMRYNTTVPQQALFFLNSPLVVEMAAATAARATGSTVEARIQALYSQIFSRVATPDEVAAGKKYMAQDEAPPPEVAASVWRYGTLSSSGFAPFAVFANETWQGGASLPAKDTGKAFLRPAGGEPGEGAAQAVVRRFTSPVSGKLNIEGQLRHGQGAVVYGDGVRGRIVSSRLGELASWSVNGSSAETKLNGLKVEAGDTFDFIVDGRQDPENDAFNWAPTVKVGNQSWSAKDEFAGPAPKRLDAWGRYAQVLLQTNEFAFVD